VKQGKSGYLLYSCSIDVERGEGGNTLEKFRGSFTSFPGPNIFDDFLYLSTRDCICLALENDLLICPCGSSSPFKFVYVE